jgi:UDP-3-O-[3-hydroxymyristoyl] glucosamine N-acyltransferase
VDLAAELGRDLEGDGELEIRGVAPLESAGAADLSFARSRHYAERVRSTRAGALIAPLDLDVGRRAVIRSPIPGLDFARAVRRIAPQPPPAPGVHATASVAQGAQIDPTASIGPRCAVEPGCAVGPRSVLHPGVTLYPKVRLGADCVLHAGCVLREGTVVGDRVVLQPGVVLGGDGFGYVADESGALEKVPQIGGVVVEDDVEIGANTTVDRGTLGDTRIGRAAKIDNLVQIAHNCTIGERVIIVAQAGLGGSTTVEAGAVVLAQAGVVGHLRIGSGAVVGPQSGIHRDVPSGAHVLGSPQREAKSFRRVMAALTRLPDLRRRVRALERELARRGGDPKP